MVLACLFICCTTEDDQTSLNAEPIFIKSPERIIKIDIIYVLDSAKMDPLIYNLNEIDFINYLNGQFFHRYDIGFILGETKTLISKELYDLRDNRGSEASTFFMETQKSYKKDRVNIYIIKRENTIGIAGLGKNQRALITDEFLYKTTSPHEIGHALGLFHCAEEGNIMCQINPHLRKTFMNTQVEKMKKCIDKINLYR